MTMGVMERYMFKLQTVVAVHAVVLTATVACLFTSLVLGRDDVTHDCVKIQNAVAVLIVFLLINLSGVFCTLCLAGKCQESCHRWKAVSVHVILNTGPVALLSYVPLNKEIVQICMNQWIPKVCIIALVLCAILFVVEVSILLCSDSGSLRMKSKTTGIVGHQIVYVKCEQHGTIEKRNLEQLELV